LSRAGAQNMCRFRGGAEATYKAFEITSRAFKSIWGYWIFPVVAFTPEIWLTQKSFFACVEIWRLRSQHARTRSRRCDLRVQICILTVLLFLGSLRYLRQGFLFSGPMPNTN